MPFAVTISWPLEIETIAPTIPSSAAAMVVSAMNGGLVCFT